METNVPGTGIKRFECPSCSKSYLREPSLKEHILKNHVKGEKSYPCEKCLEDNQLKKSFPTKLSFYDHMRKAHAPLRFKCQVCFKTFNNRFNFRKHEGIHLSNFGKKQYSCEYCSKAVGSKPALQKHVFNVHNRKTEGATYLKCQFCDAEFVTQSYLERHVVRHHVEVVDKKFECHVCSKTFIDQAALDKHMGNHDTRIKYICSKGYKCKPNLIRHLEIVHKKLLYCDQCSRSFSNKSEFEEHLGPTTGSLEIKSRLKCTICSESFDSQCNLDFHTNSHLKEINSQEDNHSRPISENTKFGSTEKFNLEFQCELCTKSFDRQSYLHAHRNQVHPNSKWACRFQECTKTFTSYSLLRNHKLTHEKTKPFSCHICQKSFCRLWSLKTHQQIHIDTKNKNVLLE